MMLADSDACHDYHKHLYPIRYPCLVADSGSGVQRNRTAFEAILLPMVNPDQQPQHGHLTRAGLAKSITCCLDTYTPEQLLADPRLHPCLHAISFPWRHS
jgi:hypothetical protein